MQIKFGIGGLVVAMATAVLLSNAVQARDDRVKMSIKEAMDTEEAKNLLGDDIKFFFGKESTPKAARTFGTFTANKKTNFANKSDSEGCARAFLSSMIALRDRARREGANAVVNIESYYKKEVFNSATEYECAAGNILGGVALRGTVAKL